MTVSAAPRSHVDIQNAVVRFAGDSGDGMQLTGTEFTREAALHGNDLATFPDYPAEIRAPAGTTAGVSGYQIQFAAHEVYSPGDQPDTLVAMNPAALKVHLADLKRGGLLILNEAAFKQADLDRAGWKSNPLTDGTVENYRVIKVDFERLVGKAVEGTGVSAKDASRCKNFYALGLVFWIYSRDTEREEQAIRDRFKKTAPLAEANVRAFKAGYNYGETIEALDAYVIQPARLKPGKYRNVTGNSALALGLIAAAQNAGLRLFYGSYPITPASDILHELSKYRRFHLTTFQAEDEIAAISAAIGASFAGALGITGSSGPGLALKTEAMGLALMTELPLVIINVQRGGPSTGLPTKTEQSDLFQAVYGRNGESPIPVVASRSPADCFDTAYEACRIAIDCRTPVILLSDGSLANGSEPWLLPDVNSLPKIDPNITTDPAGFLPYKRDEKLARPWAIPGTPGLEHRIGGLEKDALTGNISYDAQNHEKMVRTRAEKVRRIADRLDPTEPYFDPDGDVLVIGWGGTYGSITQAVIEARQQGLRVGHVHLRHIFPLPNDLTDVVSRYRNVLVPELNTGQLRLHMRGQLGIESIGLNKIQGKPFHVAEVRSAIESLARRNPLAAEQEIA
ncbi:MAG: 2-oxoacid:acceptor oxidoreductase subunit alpha [Deltaproteobacteria bacterium]|nr:MAG: 2-oxoacid:acceptor oxidoreductase subunit alpha [Deltaproteobacteria bacterium]TMB32977.1 MAG: 2-oxoacid:acceptor oxidoreductase subunit alpha [Deltaproteobacteria bacterium]